MGSKSEILKILFVCLTQHTSLKIHTLLFAFSKIYKNIAILKLIYIDVMLTQ
jgi:hypothetical protein